VETDNENYDVSETAIKDHSMLGAHGEELCSNLDVHWMTQTCGSPKNETRKCVSVCVCPVTNFCLFRKMPSLPVTFMFGVGFGVPQFGILNSWSVEVLKGIPLEHFIFHQ